MLRSATIALGLVPMALPPRCRLWNDHDEIWYIPYITYMKKIHSILTSVVSESLVWEMG